MSKMLFKWNKIPWGECGFPLHRGSLLPWNRDQWTSWYTVQEVCPKIALLKDDNEILWIYNVNGVPTVLERKNDSCSELVCPEVLKNYFSSKIHLSSVGKTPQKYFFLETGRELLVWKYGEEIEKKIERNIGTIGFQRCFCTKKCAKQAAWRWRKSRTNQSVQIKSPVQYQSWNQNSA